MPETPGAGAVFELGMLGAADTSVREAAWERLIASHSRLLLAVSRSLGGDEDDAMERYAFVLEKCREHDFRRLRAFDPAGPASFSTWLAVTARRLCVDHDRARIGRRPPSSSARATARWDLRRALSDGGSSGVDVDEVPDDSAVSAEVAALRAERDASLRSAIAMLAPQDRLLLTLRFQDNLSAARIARLLDMPTPFHVYRHLRSVLRRLRATLEGRGIDGIGE